MSWKTGLILAFIVIQLCVPLLYFTRRDPHDERFAWRMFSPMRMAQCTPRFALDGTPVVLEREFHEAWITLAERGRFVVLEAMAAKLCAEHAGSEVTLSLECTYLDRDPRTYGGYNMCAVPQL